MAKWLDWLDQLRTADPVVAPEVWEPINRLAHEVPFLDYLLQLEATQADQDDLRDSVEPLRAYVLRGAWDQMAERVSEVETALARLGPLCKAYTITYAGHAHMDMNWLWDWPETVAMVINTLTTACQLLGEVPGFKFSQSQTAVYEIVRQFDPALFSRIHTLVRQGRWEITANQWVEGDKNLASDESIVRHLLYSKAFFAEHWGIASQDIPLDFEPDTFGHPQGMPTLLRQADVRWLYYCRGGPGLTGFRWQAPDGSEVLAWSDFKQWYGGPVTGQEGLGALRWFEQSGVRQFLKVYGVGDHGGGPTRRDLQRILQYQHWPLFPRVQFGTFADHFEALENERERLPMVTSELNAVFPGCYTTVVEMKTQNAELEVALRTAEGLRVMVDGMGVGVPATGVRLQSAWQRLLFNQFHDILSGSGLVDTYHYALGQGQQGIAIAQMATHQAMEALAGVVQTDAGDADSVPIVIANPLAWQRRNVVEVAVFERFATGTPLTMTDAQGRTVPIQYRYDHHMGFDRVRVLFAAEVEGLGYGTFFLRAGIAPGEAGQEDITVATRGEGHAVARWSGLAIGAQGLAAESSSWRTEALPEDLVVFRKLGLSTYQQGWTIETPWYRASVQSGMSGLAYLMWHETGEVSENGVGALEYHVEEPHGMTAWEVGADQVRQRVTRTRWTVAEVGPVRIVLQAEDQIGPSTVTTRVAFYADHPRIEWDVDLDWRETGSRQMGVPGLSIRFPTVEAMAAQFGQPLGSITRSLPSRDVSAQGWTAVTSASGAQTTVFHPTRYGLSVQMGAIGITLVRAAYDPDPYAEYGHHRVRVGLESRPSRSSDMLTRAAMEMASAMVGMATQRHPGTLELTGGMLELVGSEGVVTAVKPAEDGRGAIVRVRQDSAVSRDLEMRIRQPGWTWEASTLLERPSSHSGKVQQRSATPAVPAHGMVTLRMVRTCSTLSRPGDNKALS